MQKVNITDDLGGVIKYARIEKHLTQKELSIRLNISLRYLKYIENSGQKPSYNLLKLTIATLDIPAELVFRKENQQSSLCLGYYYKECEQNAERKKPATK